MKNNLLNLKVITGILVLAAVLLCVTLAVLLGARPILQPSGQSQMAAVLTIIPAPTSTPRYLSPTPPLHSPTPEASPTPLPGAIAINVTVQITGTGNEGLRLRSQPGLNGEQRFLGFDTEIFQVLDGPREADGLTWWYLASPYDQSRSGWAAEDFLVVISSQPNP